MASRLNQQRIRGEELTGMTAFAAIGDVHMLSGKKRRRGKPTRVGVGMTDAALIQSGDMIGLFIDGSDGSIIGISIVTGLAIVSDARVKKGLRRLERRTGGVTYNAVLACRDVSPGFPGGDATVVTGHAITGNSRMAETRPGEGSCTEMTVYAILVVGNGGDVIKGLT